MPCPPAQQRRLRAALAPATAIMLSPLFGLPSAQAAASDPDQLARIELSEPPGFSALTGTQSAVADIYFGGKRIGEARVAYQPGSLTFADPAQLVTLLPDLADVPAVLAALSAADVPSNPGLVCTPSTNPAACGRLAPQVAGIIFDQDRFRIDIFVNPRMMTVKDAVGRQYLQRPDPGLSVVNAIGAVMSGSSQGPRFYNVQNNFILGDADRRLRAEFAYATGFGVQADRLVMEIDRPERRYMAGAFWAPGTDLIGRRKMLGVGIETQIDTRLDKDEIWGNPLVVFLGQRARVDIVRDGRVLTSRIYDAGNQSLDTRGLPNGAYEVTLQIEEAGGLQRNEKRFFSKNQNIAAVGQKIFFAYAGVLADDTRRAFIAPTSTPFVQAGIARRLNAHLALDATVLATDRAVQGQVGGFFLSPLAQVRLAAVGSSRGQYGALLQVGSPGGSRFAFNFDLRRISLGKQAPLASPPPGRFGPDAFTGGADAALPLARNSFSQVSGSISYNLRNARIAFAASYRREKNQPVNYSYGPSASWEFLRRGPLRMSVNGDLAITSQGKSGFAGVSLQLLGARSSVSADAGMRSTGTTGEARRSGGVGSVRGTWKEEFFSGAELNLAAGYDRDLERDALNANAEMRSDTFSLQGDVVHGLGQARNPTQYSLGIQTTIAMSGGRIALKGRDQNDSMVIVKVEGAGPDDRFEVLVNDGAEGIVRGGSSTAVAMPAYRQYDIRIRQTEGDLLHYDGSVRRVGLYPGNVAKLSWTARKVTAMFGRLVLENGEPVRMAAVTNPAGIGETDEDGYFQIEGEIGSVIEVAMSDGRSCRIALPQVRPQDGYAALGTLVCRAQAAPFRISSAAPE
jgi:Mat/Ecp fimbriae outer membrane usher protein